MRHPPSLAEGAFYALSDSNIVIVLVFHFTDVNGLFPERAVIRQFIMHYMQLLRIPFVHIYD
jgi:hypothetical protein